MDLKIDSMLEIVEEFPPCEFDTIAILDFYWEHDITKQIFTLTKYKY